MKSPTNFVRGTHTTIKRAWLLTWEWAGVHVKMQNKFVAIISSRYNSETIKQILERHYVSGFLSLYEQFSYTKSKKNCPYKVEKMTMGVPESLQKASSLPAQIPFDESLIIGGNPWLWGRIVYNLETWIDKDDVEHLTWKERENIFLDDDGEIKSDWRGGYLKREE